jgi:TDG/mug DNA glycosylase family protein
MHSNGFEPIANADARVLILGTLPGKASLERREYYAQPRNAFWEIMARLISTPADLCYEERTQKLLENHIALWDVCANAERFGSLDKKIRMSTVTPNDFNAFLGIHDQISLICFNGAHAERIFRRKVLPIPSVAQQP